MGLVYKRPRLSCRHERDQENFDRCQPTLKNTQDAEQKGIMNLFYFDEAGFSQQPCALCLATERRTATTTFGQELPCEHSWFHESQQ